jgi:hypothetical protein
MPAVINVPAITDARRVEFTPSADYNSADTASGVQLVTNYRLGVYVSGGGHPPPSSSI